MMFKGFYDAGDPARFTPLGYLLPVTSISPENGLTMPVRAARAD